MFEYYLHGNQSTNIVIAIGVGRDGALNKTIWEK